LPLSLCAAALTPCHTSHTSHSLSCQDGYTFLDVRSKTEYEYKIAFSVNVPLLHAVFKFDPETKKKVPHQSVNASFVKEVEAKFAKDAKLIVTCSDGRTRTLSALQALDEAGFTHIVGMKNGYNGFSAVFDNKFNRRVDPDAMREVDARDFPDQSTGIFGTGASYDRVDSVQWVPVRDPIPWLDYAEELAKVAAAA
jgi:rhodanese-related sulfurtransferase